MNTLLEHQYEFSRFAISEATNQTAILNSINEAIALESGDYAQIGAINESVVDGIKSIIKKIVDKIKELFNKFATKANQLMLSDKSWLAKYKDTITKNAFKSRGITMNTYDEKKLNDGFLIPEFNFNDFKEIATADNREKAYISKYFKDLNPDNDLKEQIIEVIQGEDEVETNFTSLDKNAIFNFCVGYANTVEKLKKDNDTITKAQSLLEQELGKLSRELEVEQRNKEAAAKTAQSNNDTNDKEEGAKTESVTFYSALYESYITELTMDKKDNNKSSSGSSSAPKSTVNSGADKMNLGSNQAKDAVSKYGNDLNSDNETKQKELEKMREGATTYFTLAGTIVTAKMTVAAKMYKDYMQILRAHVADYAGESAKGNGDNVNAGPDKNVDGTFKIGEDNYTISYKAQFRTAVAKQGIIFNKKDVLQTGNDVPEAIVNFLNKFSSKLGISPTDSTIFLVKGPQTFYATFVDNKWKYANKVEEENKVRELRKKHGVQEQ